MAGTRTVKTARAAGHLILAAGFVAGITQVLLIRELLLACYGNETSLGLMLATWLVCGAAGALLASWRRITPGQSLQATVRRLLKLVALLAPGLVFGIAFSRLYILLASTIPMRLADMFESIHIVAHVFRVYVAAQPGEMLGPLHLVLISFGTAMFPAVIFGALFAVGLKCFEQVREGDAATVGHAYALDAIGHLVGGVLLGWAAAGALNPLLVCALACGVLYLAAVRLAGACGLATRGLTLGATALFALALLAALPLNTVLSGVRWQGRELLDQTSSVHGHIAVSRHGEEGVIFYQDGVPTGISPGLPEVQAIVHFTMLQHPAPRRVLLIGGGATGGLHEVLKHDPERVDYVEMDPALLRFAQKWVKGRDRAALHDPRVSTHATDGRMMVRQACVGQREKYDVILLLAPDPSTALLNRFYTDGWFTEASHGLEPRGVLGWDITSSRGYFRQSLSLLNNSILQAAESVFPRRALMIGDETLAVVCSDGRRELTEDVKTLRRRLDERGVEAEYFDAVAKDRLNPRLREIVLAELAEGPAVRMNRDQEPVGYYYDQAVWLGFYFQQIEDFYIRLGRLRLAHLVLPGLALLGLCLLGGVTRFGRASYVPLAIMVTGALGMALELCIIFAVQSYFGYVHKWIGGIIGAFMVGLAMGAVVGARWARRGDAGRCCGWLLALTQLAVAALALLLPAAMAFATGCHMATPLVSLAGVLVFALLTVAVGFSVGVQFPLASRSLRRPDEGSGQARAAAVLYASDLLGASVGAVMMGAVFIPVLGIPQTCLAAAGISVGMAMLLSLRALIDR